MTAIVAWAARMFAGFLPSSGAKLGKILWVCGICIAVLFVYHKLTQSGTSTTQSAGDGGQIASYTIAPNTRFGGCASIRVEERRNAAQKKTKDITSGK